MASMTSFAPVADMKANPLSRRWGGNTKAIAEPAVNGYHFIKFDNFPAKLANYVPGLELGDITSILSAACLAVTPPGGTLGKVEFTGLGGVKWAVPGNVDYGTSISIKFLEFSGLPILKIFHGWVKMIRDYRTGIAMSKESSGNPYSKKDYAANLTYCTTSPDVQLVEFGAFYDGIFPLKDPQDLFSSDVETVGRIDTEIEFNVDYAWTDETWVNKKCEALAQAAYDANKTVNAYGQA
jgi:hypothetical protein